MTHSPTMRPAWTPLNIALMVLGFIVFWPLGLAMLAYILWGDRLRDEFDGLRGRMHRSRFRDSGNLAFDEYRRRELERLDAERRRLDEERREFEEFVRDLRRARDQEEFERFRARRRQGETVEAATTA